MKNNIIKLIYKKISTWAIVFVLIFWDTDKNVGNKLQSHLQTLEIDVCNEMNTWYVSAAEVRLSAAAELGCELVTDTGSTTSSTRINKE